MSRGSVSLASKNVQAILQMVVNSDQTELAHSRRRHLDGERNAVKLTADVYSHGNVLFRHSKFAIGITRTNCEQLQGAEPNSPLQWCIRRRYRQGG